eukprot:524694_1
MNQQYWTKKAVHYYTGSLISAFGTNNMVILTNIIDFLLNIEKDAIADVERKECTHCGRNIENLIIPINVIETSAINFQSIIPALKLQQHIKNLQICGFTTDGCNENNPFLLQHYAEFAIKLTEHVTSNLRVIPLCYSPKSDVIIVNLTHMDFDERVQHMKSRWPAHPIAKHILKHYGPENIKLIGFGTTLINHQLTNEHLVFGDLQKTINKNNNNNTDALNDGLGYTAKYLTLQIALTQSKDNIFDVSFSRQ